MRDARIRKQQALKNKTPRGKAYQLLLRGRTPRWRYGAFVSHLDLSRAPYVLYGVKYIDLVSLGAFVSRFPPYFFLPHFRLYEVVSLHMCVLPHK